MLSIYPKTSFKPRYEKFVTLELVSFNIDLFGKINLLPIKILFCKKDAFKNSTNPNKDTCVRVFLLLKESPA